MVPEKFKVLLKPQFTADHVALAPGQGRPQRRGPPAKWRCAALACASHLQRKQVINRQKQIHNEKQMPTRSVTSGMSLTDTKLLPAGRASISAENNSPKCSERGSTAGCACATAHCTRLIIPWEERQGQPKDSNQVTPTFVNLTVPWSMRPRVLVSDGDGTSLGRPPVPWSGRGR